MNNPFQPAEHVQKKLKVLIYGASGSGKTRFALTFPGRIAVIDTEGGTELYGGREDVQAFDVLRTKTYAEIMAALDFIEADNGKTYQTVVLDPITVVWQILIEAAGEYKAANGKRPLVTGDGAINNRGWGVIKQRVNALYARLTNLPVHVVVTSRLKDQYDKRGDDLVKVGVAPDAEKSVPYLFDVVLRIEANKQGQRRAIVEKDRSNTLAPIVDNIAYSDLAVIAGKYTTGTQIVHKSDSAAATEQASDLFSDHDDERPAAATATQPTEPPAGSEPPNDLEQHLGKRVTRPYTPEQLKRRMVELVEGKMNVAQAGDLMEQSNIIHIANTFKRLNSNDDERHVFTLAMFGKASMNEMIKAEGWAITEWSKVLPNAIKELADVLASDLAAAA